MNKLKTWINADIILATAFVFALLYAVSKIPLNTDIIDPIGKALEDFDLSDMVYTATRDEMPKDTNITLVNIGNLNRAQLSVLMDNLNKYQPKVIGIDARFVKDKTEFYRERGLVNGDSLLELAFEKTENLVLATKLQDYSDTLNQWQAVETSIPRLMKSAHAGFVNMITKEDDFRVSRKIVPVDFVNDEMQIFFPVKIASFVAPDKVDKFLKRPRTQQLIQFKKAHQSLTEDQSEKLPETIYYRGNINNFSTEKDVFGKGDAFLKLDVDEILADEFDTRLVKDKVLILGYMGDRITNDLFWDEDKFYTPLNKKYAGKSFPDMYGVTVHANIVSMILNETYVDEVDTNFNLWVNVLLCMMWVLLFSYIFHRVKLWWDGLSALITMVGAFAIAAVEVYIFHFYRLTIDFSFSMIFLFVLGNFLELYYELVKPGLIWVVDRIRK